MTVLRWAGAVRFPDLYCWYVLASTLDIVVTFIIIEVYRGGEGNAIALRIFNRFGWHGMIVLKYATVLIVVLACEYVARSKPGRARALAVLAVVVSAMPVLWGAIQIWLWVRGVIVGPEIDLA